MPLPIAIPIAIAAASMLSNAASQNASNKSTQEAIDTLKLGQGYADQMNRAGQQNYMDMLSAGYGLYGDPNDAASALKTAQAGLNSVNPYEAGQFEYSKSLEDFYDPAYGLSVNTANDGINQSQALGGNLFSSDTANKLAAQNNVMATNMYKEALNAYQTDKSLEQGIWQGNEAARQAEAQSNLGLAQAQYNMANDTASNLNDLQNAYYQGMGQLNQDYFQNKTDYLAALANMQASKGAKTSILDPLGLMNLFN